MYFSKHAIFFVMQAPGHIMSATNLWKCPSVVWLFFHASRRLAALILDTPLRFYGDLVQVLCRALGKPNASSLLYISCIYQTILTENATCFHVLRLGNLQYRSTPWWRHQMETFSALLDLCAGNSPVTSEFPSQRPVTRSFDVSLICALNKRLSKQSRGWWFETTSRSSWRHCNDISFETTQLKWLPSITPRNSWFYQWADIAVNTLYSSPLKIFFCLFNINPFGTEMFASKNMSAIGNVRRKCLLCAIVRA